MMVYFHEMVILLSHSFKGFDFISAVSDLNLIHYNLTEILYNMKNNCRLCKYYTLLRFFFGAGTAQSL
jgi:hypothetical protein